MSGVGGVGSSGGARSVSNNNSLSNNTHTVKSGETLSGIAQQHKVALDDLLKANPQIKNPDLIFPDQVVNLPGRQGTAGGGQTDATGNTTGTANTDTTTGTGATTGTAQPSDQFQAAGTATPPQVQANPNGGGSSTSRPPANPDLAAQVAAQRANANASPTLTGGAGSAARNQGATQHRIHHRRPDGKVDPRNANLMGTSWERSSQGTADRRAVTTLGREGRTSSATSSSRTDVSVGGGTLEQRTREGSATNRTTGRSVSTMSEHNSLHDREGNSVTEHTRVSEDDRGRLSMRHEEQSRLRNADGTFDRTTESVTDTPNGRRRTFNDGAGEGGTTSTQRDERRRQRRVAADTISDATSVNGQLFNERLAGDADFHGAYVNDDHQLREDRTGAGYETHALAAQGEVRAAGNVNLRNGEVNVGVNASVQADLVGASARAQVGTTDSAAGAGFVEGEAHVGARADVGAGVTIDPRRGQVGVRAGAEAFAGAEARVSGGYENRWGGASVTARGQAGIGGAAQAEIGYDNGRFRARADLGACVGLGGRVTIDVNVNVGNIVSDVGGAVGGAVSGAWDTVSGWF